MLQSENVEREKEMKTFTSIIFSDSAQDFTQKIYIHIGNADSSKDLWQYI